MGIVDRFSKGEATPTNAQNYIWGDNCDGWHLLKRDDLSIITERVPPGESEQPHFHLHSRQFFYILTGEAVIEVDGNKQILQAQQGIEIPPGVVHQFRNESNSDVTFLVISMPKSHGDRVSVTS
jgi:mannose-6-phosphate isomerase-like protein (cupin superfamily)